MIHRLASQRTAAAPVTAPRVNPTRGQATPVFSVGKAAGDSGATVATQSLARVAPPSSAAAPQSQINSGAADFRQLFSGSPVAAAIATPAPTPTPAPFVPQFRTATGSGVGNDGNPVSWNLNSTYFATKDTAQWIANKYGTGQVIDT